MLPQAALAVSGAHPWAPYFFILEVTKTGARQSAAPDLEPEIIEITKDCDRQVALL